MVQVIKRILGHERGTVRGRVIGMYIVLIGANIGLWVLAAATFRHYPVLLGTCFLGL